MSVSNVTGDAATRTLRELLLRIEAASERFDRGWHTAAAPLAGHIRALIHHAVDAAAKSEVVGVKDALAWVDTAGVPNPKVTCPTAGLTLMRIRSRHHGEEAYVPKLSMYPPMPIRTRSGERIDSGSRIPFEHWWTNPVITEVDGLQYSREQLVLALCGHDDPQARAARRALGDSASLGWVVDEAADGESKPLDGSPVIASIRQIAHEVLQSFTERGGIVRAAS